MATKAVVQRKTAIDSAMSGMAKTAEGAVSGIAEARENRKAYIQNMEARFKNQADFDDTLRKLQFQADEGKLTRAQEAELAEAQLRFDEWKTTYTTTEQSNIERLNREAAERDSKRNYDLGRRKITSEEQQLQARLEADLQKDGGHMRNNAATAAVTLQSIGMSSADYAALPLEEQRKVLAIALKTTGFTFSQEHDWMQDADAQMFDKMLRNSDAYQASLDEKESKKFQRAVDAEIKVKQAGQASGQAAGGVPDLGDDQYVAEARPEMSPVTGMLFTVPPGEKPKSPLELSGVGVNFDAFKSRVSAAPLNNTKALLDQQVRLIVDATSSSQKAALAQQANIALVRHMQATYGNIPSLSANEKQDMLKALQSVIESAARPAVMVGAGGVMGEQVYPSKPVPKNQKNSGQRGI